MATNISKTEHFTSGSGTQISFSDIRTAFGGSSENIKASEYLRNVDADVDWSDEKTINRRVPDCKENESVSTSDSWKVDDLRNTISEYNVTQTGSEQGLSYSDSNTSTWNGNLNRNVVKKFIVNGVISSPNTQHAGSSYTYPLSFSGDMYNLSIDVNKNGAIYGSGGNVNTDGGDALFVNNSYTESKVKISSFGKIWAGGAGGSSGNPGNDGSRINCYQNANWTYIGNSGDRKYDESVSSAGCKAARPSGISNGKLYAANPHSGTRSRCRGGGARAGQGWNSKNFRGYQCTRVWKGFCRGTGNFVVGPANGGNAGNGGKGKGFANINTSINSSPHKGNSGNSGQVLSCNTTGGKSIGNSGNSGNSGGDWGQSSGSKKGGAAVRKRGANLVYYTDTTLKGKIKGI